MRDHPIPPVTEPLQYRAIGIVRGKYVPNDLDKLSRGIIVDLKGLELEAVVLGRVLNLMRRHLEMELPHIWVVYPRCREAKHLHLQIAGIWEPSTLSTIPNVGEKNISINNQIKDDLPEGDDYFSIRGELIYSRQETQDLVVKVRQRPRADGSKPIPFKLQLKGNISMEYLRNFVDLKVRRLGQQLHVESHEIIAPLMNKRGVNRQEQRVKQPVNRVKQKK